MDWVVQRSSRTEILQLSLAAHDARIHMYDVINIITIHHQDDATAIPRKMPRTMVVVMMPVTMKENEAADNYGHG